jgi:Fe-S-cluster-containing dehydrogenase component/formate-dependent nitrite reductase membrane component NrfD
VQYGFVIDHESCIGCHACTVACKAENNVPVGNFRTSVKYVEQGRFPDVKRMFLVQRCNHCTDAPCVTICPVNALEKRRDGIVDLDRDACIGCRACMQACPYDAIYLNEDLGAVEKCHFCAHRVEKSLEPACVIVCPVGAIITGDFHDPQSRVSQLVKNNEAKARRVEQGTGPNVRYLGVDDVALYPGRAVRPETYLFSDRPPTRPEAWPGGLPLDDDARVVLDAGHRVEWGWPVALYLVTKGIAAGRAMLAPFAAAFGFTGFTLHYAPELIALVFTLITCGILVEDLGKPWTFYKMLTRPNFKSWLVLGGIILTVFIATVSLTIVLRMLGLHGAADAMRWVNAIIGVAVAGYTAFLFAQCKGRDLWESKWLLPHLLVQAILVGAAMHLALVRPWSLRWMVIVAALAHLALSLFERHRHHETENARQAAAFLPQIKFGPFNCWRDGLIVGTILTVLLVFIAPPLAWIPAWFGLFLYEHAYVRAGQLPPLS